MSLVVIVLGVVLLTLPALTVRLRLGSAARVRVACTAIAAGIWSILAGSVLTASPLLVWWHDAEEAERFARIHLSPGGVWAWTAGGAFGVLGAVLIAESLRKVSATRRRAGLPRWASESFSDDSNAGAEVRYASSSDRFAFAVPGRDQHVVVSQALRELLSEDQMRLVLAHEGAHLRLRHDRYLLLLSVYDRVWGWLPGVRWVVGHHRHALECWADSEAARSLRVDPAVGAEARLALQSDQGAFGCGLTEAWAGHTSRLHLMAMTLLLAGLVAAVLYGATHTVQDFQAAFASMH